MRLRPIAPLGLILLFLAAGCSDAGLPTDVTAPEVLLHHSPGHGGGPGGGGSGDGGGEMANYEAILLPGGNNSIAYDINDAGVAVGWIDGAAVRWVVSSASISGPDALGSLPSPYTYSAHALAVNAGGTIVGRGETGGFRDGAFMYTDGMGMQLLPQVADTYRSEALAINDQGIAVGTIEFADDGGDVISRGAVWLNTTDEPILLPPLEGYSGSVAKAVNNGGLIAGESGGQLVTWQLTATEGLVDGPHPHEAAFRVEAMNNGGDIVGSKFTPVDNVEALLMRAGSAVLLGSLLSDEQSMAHGTNDPTADGVVQIVGSSWPWATLWTVDADNNVEGPVNIGAPSRSVNATAFAINGQDWIVGRSGTRNIGQRATLWLPQQDDGGHDDCKPHPRTGECR